ncbi:MAG: thermonuclease family protein [Planctomycetes bacterium]|nr:thermonuclease family protein [Planctomycetota bacterium]
MSKARRPASPAPRKPAGAATGATIALALALVVALVAVALWAADGTPTTPDVVDVPPPVSEPVAPAPRVAEPAPPRPPVRPPEREPEPEPDPEPEPEPVAKPAFATSWIKGPTESARVKRVIDGDTLELTDGRRVRLVGINTPEKDEPLYAEATAALKELVDGQQITLEFDRERTDQYKRTLAYVFKGELFANGEVVRRGLAYCYTWEPNTAHRDELVTFQREARAARRGLWALPTPAPESVYVADERGHRFHRPSCARVPRIRSKLEFRSRDEALDAGQNPCGDCTP